jgi:hypothetical protein
MEPDPEKPALSDGPKFQGSTLVTSARGDVEVASSPWQDVSASLEAEPVLREGLAFADSTSVTSVGGEDDAVLYELVRALAEAPRISGSFRARISEFNEGRGAVLGVLDDRELR